MSGHSVVIGAGANALVAAHTLARAGRKVLVLDAHTLHEEEGWIPPQIVDGLGLRSAGLEIRAPDPWLTIPLADGGRLELARDVGRAAEAIGRVSPHDAARWPDFCARMARLAHLLEALYLAPPPDLLRGGLGGFAREARLGLRVRGLGRAGIEDLMRVLPMSAADLLDDWFESDALKGALGAFAVRHLRHGPRAGGTAYAFLHRHAGSAPGVFAPAPSNVANVLARLPGIEVRRGTDVEAIEVQAGKVTGVVLPSGERIAASTVVSGIDPRRTLLELVDPGWLDPELVRAVRHIRARGVTARVTLVLDRPPGFGALTLAPSLDYVERASDDAKYGRVSGQPFLDARVGSPPADGRHRLEVHVQYAPCALAGGEWDAARKSALGDAVVNMLAEHLPFGIAAIAERRILAPPDLEQQAGWPEGQPHHAELALDQALWMRPVPALARYRAPVAGLFLCGPAMHPGGGIAGAAGASAARAILAE